MTDLPENKRRADRLYHEVLVAYRSGSVHASGCALDFSSVGLFMNSSEILPPGTELKLVVYIPGLDAPLELRGRVVRIISADEARKKGTAPGMGVEFLDVSRESREKIDAAVQMLKPVIPGLNECSAPPHRA